jgi:hypothetical protein
MDSNRIDFPGHGKPLGGCNLNGIAFDKLHFAAGTVILRNEVRKAIEDIVVGDHVWAWDEETGEKSLRRVTETYVNQTSEFVHH